MTYPFGIDISAYQYSQDGSRKPDFDLINEKCDFVAVRAGISWGYTDKWFEYSWSHVLRPRLAYHVVYPGESATAQMKHFLNIVHPTQNDRLVLDMELDHGYSKARITKTLVDCMNIIQTETGRYPVIYSRAYWVNDHLDVNALPEKTDWWLANYLRSNPDPYFTPEMTPPPMLPNGVKNWLIHQTSKEQDGSKVGVVSHYVDTNRWNGTHDELLAYFGYADQPEPEPTPEPIPEPEPLFQGVVITSPGYRLITRKTPGGEANPDSMWYNSGDNVDVFEISGDWYQTATALPKWASANWINRTDYIPPTVAEFLYFGAIYNQRDERWKDHALGTKSTIGNHGCLMTCAAMVCNKFGHMENPLELNDWLTSHGGYLDGNLYLWDAIERLYPDMKFDGFVYQPTTAQIISKIRSGIMPILCVDFDDSTPLLDMHWVVGIGIMGNDVIIGDPWTGTIGMLSEEYAGKSVRFGSYRRK